MIHYHELLILMVGDVATVLPEAPISILGEDGVLLSEAGDLLLDRARRRFSNRCAEILFFTNWL